MHNPAHSMSCLKSVVLAGALLLASRPVLAQQEVSPDHFDVEAPTVAQATAAGANGKGSVASRKSTTAAKPRQAQAKAAHDPQKAHLARASAGPQKVVAASHAH